MFWSRSEDVHIVLGIILRVVLLLFSQVAFSRFLCVYYYQNDQIMGTLCAPLILPFYADSFTLYRCFCHGLIFFIIFREVQCYQCLYSKTCLKQPIKNRQNKDLNDK